MGGGGDDDDGDRGRKRGVRGFFAGLKEELTLCETLDANRWHAYETELRGFISWCPTRIEVGKREGKGRDFVYLSLQFPAMPVVPEQRIMMLDLREGPVQ